MKNAEDNLDENPVNISQNKEMEPEEEKIVLREFDKTEKKFALSLDTLGQDRIFDEKEVAFIKEVAESIKSSWEQIETTLLLKDRDLRIEMIDKETKYRDIVSQ